MAQPEVPALQTVGEILARPVKGLTLDELGQARRLAQHVRTWLKEVDEEVKQRLLHDLKVPGARLGQGRGKRAWGGSPEEIKAAVAATAEALGADETEFYPAPDLKSPAQLEKQFGKGQFKDTPLAKLVAYTAGGPVVVDEDSDTPEWAPSDTFEGEAEPEKDVTSSLL